MLVNSEVLTWSDVLGEEKAKPYFKDILAFLEREKNAGKIIYPAQNRLFSAFSHTAYENVKVVILGQDPYHGPGQAHGLSFSVNLGIRPPPSLLNIFRELKSDLNISQPQHGFLEKWAKEGVLLLNTSLSVEAGKPQSHAHIGWSQFTDKVIASLNAHYLPVVFLLWGAHAKSKQVLINNKKHLILTAAHPSPFSAHQGFLGCRHISQTNNFLQENGRGPIDWSLD